MSSPPRANDPTATIPGANDVATFRRALQKLAPTLVRDLPWIGHASPWAVFVSEVMLQQTSTSRVIEPWRRFMAAYPTPGACANAPLSEVLTLWRGLGYHRRAKALHDAARVLRDELNDTVPRDVKQLRSLPGVGEYTAHAVASFAYAVPVAVVDTNVGRVLARALAGRTLRADEARVLARKLLPRTDSTRFNQAMLDLGAQFCRSTPRCGECPVSRYCAWHRSGGDDPARNSAAVSRPQSRFEGSDRQLRGRVLNALREGPCSYGQLEECFRGIAISRRDHVLDSLVHDGLVRQSPRGFSLAPGAARVSTR